MKEELERYINLRKRKLRLDKEQLHFRPLKSRVRIDRLNSINARISELELLSSNLKTFENIEDMIEFARESWLKLKEKKDSQVKAMRMKKDE